MRGLPAACAAGAATSSGSPLHPGGEARRREQVVELHRQLEAILRREERLRGRARRRFVERRRLDLLDQCRPGRGPGPPRHARSSMRRQQDVLAASQRIGVDAGQAQQARHRRTRTRSRSSSPSSTTRARGARERREHRDRQPGAGCPACRSRNRRRRADGAMRVAVLAPFREPCLPERGLLRRELVRRSAPCARASSSSIHGRKSSAARFGKRQQQIARDRPWDR